MIFQNVEFATDIKIILQCKKLLKRIVFTNWGIRDFQVLIQDKLNIALKEVTSLNTIVVNAKKIWTIKHTRAEPKATFHCFRI